MRRPRKEPAQPMPRDSIVYNTWITNYQYEMGPCFGGYSCLSTDAPGLIPEFDGIWNIEDLMSFYIMWNAVE